MAEKEQCKRKTWTREETLGLLSCYLARKEEFTHSRKKKFAYANVLEDMICQGITSSSTTTTALEGKIRTLLMAYKAAKDNSRQTGASPCIAPYMKEMDEIFGTRPIISNTHTIHLGCSTSKNDYLKDKHQAPDSPQEWHYNDVFDENQADSFQEWDSISFNEENLWSGPINLQDTSPSEFSSNTTQPSPIEILSVAPTLSALPSAPNTSHIQTSTVTSPLATTTTSNPTDPTIAAPSPSPGLPNTSNTYSNATKTRKRKNARSSFFEAHLKMKKEIADAKQADRAELKREALALLKEKWDREFELEQTKIALLKIALTKK